MVLAMEEERDEGDLLRRARAKKTSYTRLAMRLHKARDRRDIWQ